MSRVLNYSVPELQISKQGNLTISGNDKKWYFYRVSDFFEKVGICVILYL
jgi:hypothetical protein